MTGSERNDFLIEDSLYQLLESAIRNEETISASAETLKTTTENLQKASHHLPARVANEVERAAINSADAAARQLTSKLVSVVDAAEKARKTYEDAVEFSFRRIAWQAVMASFFGIGAMVLTAWIIIPDAKKMQALREEKAWLESNIAALERQGGKVVFERCQPNTGPSRLCVRTNEAERDKVFGNPPTRTLRILWGY